MSRDLEQGAGAEDAGDSQRAAELVVGPVPDLVDGESTHELDEHGDSADFGGPGDDLSDDPSGYPGDDPNDERARGELAAVERELNKRWPETKIEPSLSRIATLVDLLGEPHRGYPIVHIAGTNGKSSTARMIDALLTRLGLRVGRYTSPHLQLVTERISLDGELISAGRYAELFHDIAPYVSMVDSASGEAGPAMSKFEVLTGMAFAAFADAPVEAAVVEVGLGGTWDATNVAEGRVAAITPIGIDHVDYLGHDIASIAREKAGVIKPGMVVVIGEQDPAAMQVLLERAVEVDATVARAGSEFAVLKRELAVGGQMISVQGLGGVYEDLYLPVHGVHQAANAALALATVEAFFGAGKERQLIIEAVREAFAELVLPGRLEPVRAAPMILVDAAHNPHGATALATAVDEEFSFRSLSAVVSVMADKDAEGILAPLQPLVNNIVLTTNSSPRAMPLSELKNIALSIFDDEQVHIESTMDAAIETAVRLVEQSDNPRDPLAGGGVLITGSVVTAGDARTLLGKDPA